MSEPSLRSQVDYIRTTQDNHREIQKDALDLNDRVAEEVVELLAREWKWQRWERGVSDTAATSEVNAFLDLIADRLKESVTARVARRADITLI